MENSWMRSNGKLSIWYVKIPLFMTFSQTYLKMDYGNAWFAVLLWEIFYQLVVDYNSVNIRTMLCLSSFQVFTNLHRRCKGEGMSPPNINWGAWSTISYQYIDPIEQLNYCLVFWISATLVFTTKVFLVQCQINTRHHLPSDPECYLVVSTKSADHLGMLDIPLWQTSRYILQFPLPPSIN